MQKPDTEHRRPISSGPFVTASGRRLPVRILSYAELPALIEFSDYLARRSPAPEIVGLDHATLESMTEREFDALTMIAVFAGPNPLIRAVAAYALTSPTQATVRFTVDDSLLPDGVFRELVRRVADDAQQHNLSSVQAPGGGTGPEREAFEASGLTFVSAAGGGSGLTVAIPELPAQAGNDGLSALIDRPSPVPRTAVPGAR